MTNPAPTQGENHVYLLRINQENQQTRVTFQNEAGTVRHGFATLQAALTFIMNHESDQNTFVTSD